MTSFTSSPWSVAIAFILALLYLTVLAIDIKNDEI